jgi:hypothetical protein
MIETTQGAVHKVRLYRGVKKFVVYMRKDKREDVYVGGEVGPVHTNDARRSL